MRLCQLCLSLMIILMSGSRRATCTMASPQANGFNHYEIVRPVLIHTQEKRLLSSTIINDSSDNTANNHINDLVVILNISGRNVTLDLKLNRDLIPKSFFVRHQVPSGESQVHRPSADQINFCEYKGLLKGVPQSWAAISTCNGLSGVIFDGKETLYIEPRSKNSVAIEDHFLYRPSALQTNRSCGFSGFSNTPSFPQHKFTSVNRAKRNADGNVIRAPFNSNRESKYVELVLVVDNTVFKNLGSSVETVSTNCRSLANIMNSIYAPLNIFIALVGVVIWTHQNEIDIHKNEADKTLERFLIYRREYLTRQHPNDNAQLLISESFDGNVVGKAYKGTMCTDKFSGGVCVFHKDDAVGSVASTLAHEMGHNFGMEHDTERCTCSTEKSCIMTESSKSKLITNWSDCSIEYLAYNFERGAGYCLRNKPEKLFEGRPICGNGFVEPGEQCDCGLPENCNNPCCNAPTCTLHQNATCATGKCCDLETCRPKKAAFECRSADYECDLPEFCSGASEYCPEDVFKMDGIPCKEAAAFCYKGTCRTHSDQCRLLWGPTGISSDDNCYKTWNVKGEPIGNCGLNRDKYNALIKCAHENVMCGTVQCKHLIGMEDRPHFGSQMVMWSKNELFPSANVIDGISQSTVCESAHIDLGLNDVDPGLAPDGAKCGQEKMCVNQKCIHVDVMKNSSCENKCNGRGVCNNLGQCHCELAYAPPDCSSAGFGGSIHSGRAANPDGTSIWLQLVIFLLALVLMVLLLFLAAFLSRRWSSKKVSSSPDDKAQPEEGSVLDRWRAWLCSQHLDLCNGIRIGRTPAQHNSDAEARRKSVIYIVVAKSEPSEPSVGASKELEIRGNAAAEPSTSSSSRAMQNRKMEMPPPLAPQAFSKNLPIAVKTSLPNLKNHNPKNPIPIHSKRSNFTSKTSKTSFEERVLAFEKK